MELRSFLSLFVLLTLCVCAQAIEYESIQDIQNTVKYHTNDYFADRFSTNSAHRNLKVEVSDLDSRLKLAKCNEPLRIEINETRNNSQNISVKASCFDNNVRQWGIFVPTRIHIYANVVVIKNSLLKGDVLTKHNIGYERVNTSILRSGHIEDINRVLGKTITRTMRTGDPLVMAYVDESDVIIKGDPVTIQVRSAFLSVSTLATALTNGYVGQTIKVRNNHSKKVVDAKVAGPGQVTIQR